MPRHVLFMYSLQDPKGMSVGLHVCKVPRWNGTDKLKKSWRSPSVCLSVCLSTVCPRTGKNWWWGWFLFLREDRENCKVLYGSSTEPQDRNHRRIWCEKAGVLVETLGKRCLNTLLVPGLDFRSFKEQMDMCVLTDEPSLWQFSWPPGQHLHLSTPPLLLLLFLVQVFLYIKRNCQPCSLTNACFSYLCSYPHSKGPAKPYHSFLSVPI